MEASYNSFRSALEAYANRKPLGDPTVSKLMSAFSAPLDDSSILHFMKAEAQSARSTRPRDWDLSCSEKLLQEVMQSLLITSRLSKHSLMSSHKSEGGKSHHSCREVIAMRLCAILSRSKEVLKDFGEFYCLRLVLDEHSPLASFFIDLFSHLEFLLLQLNSILYHDPCPDHQFANESLKVYINDSLQVLRPVTSTCRLLYATCNMLPCMISAPHLVGQTADEEFKRKGQRQGRQFSSNLLHCRMQHRAYVSLDQSGCSRVKLVQELGNGASATVYKGVFEVPPAHCRPLQKPGQSVAVKMFKDGGAESSAGRSYTAPTSSFGNQLLQSMRQMTDRDPICGDHDNVILAELEKLVVAKHPNIVTPMGYIGKRKEGECGLVMELMDESLSDHLEKVGNGSIPPLEVVEMLDLMLEIARGMRFLHECELIHLDLKPSNVLLRFSDGQDHPPQVKIADLGLTILSSLFQKKMNGCDEDTMVPLGTSCYMAPELRPTSSRNVSYDDKVDVFSFGTTCFNILIGNPDACAFSGTIKHFYATIEDREWEQWMQGRNPFVVKLIGRCWEKDPSMRPTFATLCVLLQHAIECYMVPKYTQQLSRSLASMSAWSEKHKDGREPDHLRVYAAISRYLDQESGIAPVDLEVMKRSVLEFESYVKANTNVLSLDNLIPPWMEKLLQKLHVYDNQKANTKTVCACLECEKSVQREGSSKAKEEPQLNFQTTIIESFLVGEDPLMLLKAQAYVNLLTFNSSKQKRNVRGALSSLTQRPVRLFNFREDAAHAPLQVDTSLISSLVNFWKILPPAPDKTLTQDFELTLQNFE